MRKNIENIERRATYKFKKDSSKRQFGYQIGSMCRRYNIEPEYARAILLTRLECLTLTTETLFKLYEDMWKEEGKLFADMLLGKLIERRKKRLKDCI